MDHHGHHDHHDHMDHNMNSNDNMSSVTTQIANAVVTTIASVLNATTTQDAMNHSGHHDSMQPMGGGTGHDHVHDDHGHQDNDQMGHEGHAVGGMGMHMTFYIGKTATIMFDEWHVDSVGGIIGSVIGIILLAILYEGLKFLREHLFRQYYSRLSYSSCTVSAQVAGNSNGCGAGGEAELHKVMQNRLLGWPHILQTCLHMSQVLLSYFLMLIFMTYNVWLCLAVLIGSGIGYFVFGWRKSSIVDISDHCH